MPRRPGPAEPALRRLRVCSTIALVIFVIIVAVITLWPGPPAPDGQNWLREYLRHAHQRGFPQWITLGRIEFGSNVLMFVPLGLFGALSLPRNRWLIVPAAALTAIGIETIQTMALPLRYATTKDVIANTFGALTGYLLAVIIVTFLTRGVHQIRSTPDPALR